MLCHQVVKNDKHFLDQSLDEIKLLLYLNNAGDCDEAHVLQMFDFFYYKEHLLIVTELLRDSLFNFYRYLNATQALPQGGLASLSGEPRAHLLYRRGPKGGKAVTLAGLRRLLARAGYD